MRSGNERGTPELDAVCLSGGVGLVSDAVGGDNGQSVGYGMSALNGRPCFPLPFLFVFRVAALIADGSGVDEHFCTVQRHQAGSFRIPLVPTNEDAQPSDAGVDWAKSEVAGCEIEFLVVGRVVGNVHLPVFAGDASVALEDDRRVVVESGSAPFEERGDEHDVVFLSQFAEELGGWTGYRLCLVEVVDVFHLAEIQPVVQFLQHNQFGTVVCQSGDFLGKALHVVLHVSRVVLLYDSCFHLLSCVLWVRMDGSFRELHGQAMYASMLPDDGAGVDTDDFVCRERQL